MHELSPAAVHCGLLGIRVGLDFRVLKLIPADACLRVLMSELFPGLDAQHCLSRPFPVVGSSYN